MDVVLDLFEVAEEEFHVEFTVTVGDKVQVSLHQFCFVAVTVAVTFSVTVTVCHTVGISGQEGDAGGPHPLTVKVIGKHLDCSNSGFRYTLYSCFRGRAGIKVG